MGNILEKLTARLSRGGIRSAMFASFTISALLAVVLTSVTLYVRFSAQLDAAIEEENQMLVEQVNQSLSTYLRDMIRLSDSICYNVVKNTDLDREPVSEEMRLLYNTYSDYVENMVLFTGDGQVVATAPAARVRADAEITSAPWFTSAMERTENLHFGIPAVQTLFEDAGHNYKRVVSLSCAVELTQGGDTQLGVLLIDLKYSALAALFQNVKLSGSGYVYLVAGDGTLIYHPDRPLIASGLVAESSLEAAGRPDGIYTEEWNGGRRSVIVRAVGYTGWKLVGVVPADNIWDNYGQLLLFFLFVVLFSVFLLIFVNLHLSERISVPIKALDRSVKKLEAGCELEEFEVGGPYEIEHLGHSIRSMVSTLRHLMDDIIEQETQKRRSELDVLQAQINPHFLYNTLDSVVWMTENGRTDEAILMVTSLARFFRISLSRGSNIIPIADELEHARHYLTIQKMRYKNKFSASIEAEDGVEALYTIKLIVQPILENAIYHGMAYADGDGKITVHAFREGGDVVIDVTDNGPGIPAGTVARLLDPAYTAAPGPKGSGIGLRNVHQRIRLTFGGGYGLSIHSEPDAGTRVRVRLPALDGAAAAPYRKEVAP